MRGLGSTLYYCKRLASNVLATVRNVRSPVQAAEGSESEGLKVADYKDILGVRRPSDSAVA